jgi:hypothetical protein
MLMLAAVAKPTGAWQTTAVQSRKLLESCFG